MPSPIAYLGVGYAIYHQYKNKLPQDQRSFWKIPFQLAVVAGLSLLPDLDVVPAILFKDMRAYHNNFSHSIFFAIPVSLIIASVFQRVYRSNFWMWFMICLLSYDLHVVMDALTAERGVMMLWPLTQDRFSSPIKIFYGLQWGLGWFSIWHLWTIVTESFFVGIILTAVNYFDKRRNQANKIISQQN